MTTCEPKIFGADPVNVKWSVVRGDTAILRVEFYEADEKTPLNISQWIFEATAYDAKTDTAFSLEIERDVPNGYINVVAESDVTSEWGLGIGGRIAELSFDVQVTKEDNMIWTPVLGRISILGDVTGGSL